MYARKCLTFLLFVVHIKLSRNQVLLFGPCIEVETVKFFDIEKFLGLWYEIERFPTSYEEFGQCAYKRFQACGRRIEIEHGFIKNDILYIVHVNSTYAPGNDAIFKFKKNNIDSLGIPMSILATDYTNYAVVYGCKNNDTIDIKYISAWILSREKELSPEILETAHRELNKIPYASTVYLKPVLQNIEKCTHQWTAHFNAKDVIDEENNEL
ncbi:PREDICTED: lopap-like isoform X1 [Papilio xuthus]|uniref:Lopap-like isoform X1 n=1 Tax=Papilio xuthus TaxID=66420 RepID=A0AAJ6ZEW4_PAPXU|nr:PREDICTED: lopap-like isoform X1 [Papilio xuthus]